MKKYFLLAALFALVLPCCNNSQKVSVKPSGKKVTLEEFIEKVKDYKYSDPEEFYEGKIKISGFINAESTFSDSKNAEYNSVYKCSGTVVFQITKRGNNKILEKNVKYTRTLSGKDASEGDEEVNAAEMLIGSYFGSISHRTSDIVNAVNDPYIQLRIYDFSFYTNPEQVGFNLADDYSTGVLSEYNKDGLIIKSSSKGYSTMTERMDDGEKDTRTITSSSLVNATYIK